MESALLPAGDAAGHAEQGLGEAPRSARAGVVRRVVPALRACCVRGARQGGRTDRGWRTVPAKCAMPGAWCFSATGIWGKGGPWPRACEAGDGAGTLPPATSPRREREASCWMPAICDLTFAASAADSAGMRRRRGPDGADAPWRLNTTGSPVYGSVMVCHAQATRVNSLVGARHGGLPAPNLSGAPVLVPLREKAQHALPVAYNLLDGLWPADARSCRAPYGQSQAGRGHEAGTAHRHKWLRRPTSSFPSRAGGGMEVAEEEDPAEYLGAFASRRAGPLAKAVLNRRPRSPRDPAAQSGPALPPTSRT